MSETHYTRDIKKLLNCDSITAWEIEDQMRYENGTLDHISRGKFDTSAVDLFVVFNEKMPSLGPMTDKEMNDFYHEFHEIIERLSNYAEAKGVIPSIKDSDQILQTIKKARLLSNVFTVCTGK